MDRGSGPPSRHSSCVATRESPKLARLDAAPGRFLDLFEELRMDLSNEQVIAEVVLAPPFAGPIARPRARPVGRAILGRARSRDVAGGGRGRPGKGRPASARGG